jgi:hypothetical protein
VATTGGSGTKALGIVILSLILSWKILFLWNNLKTEKPAPLQIKKAVEKVLPDNKYKRNVGQLAQEFARYNPLEITASYGHDLIEANKAKVVHLADEKVN